MRPGHPCCLAQRVADLDHHAVCPRYLNHGSDAHLGFWAPQADGAVWLHVEMVQKAGTVVPTQARAARSFPPCACAFRVVGTRSCSVDVVPRRAANEEPMAQAGGDARIVGAGEARYLLVGRPRR